MKEATYLKAANLYHNLNNIEAIIYRIKRIPGHFRWIDDESGINFSTSDLPGYLSKSILTILEVEAAHIRKELEQLKDE